MFVFLETGWCSLQITSNTPIRSGGEGRRRSACDSELFIYTPIGVNDQGKYDKLDPQTACF